MLTPLGLGLFFLCWVIGIGSFVATGFTLHRLFEMRRVRRSQQPDYAKTT